MAPAKAGAISFRKKGCLSKGISCILDFAVVNDAPQRPTASPLGKGGHIQGIGPRHPYDFQPPRVELAITNKGDRSGEDLIQGS